MHDVWQVGETLDEAEEKIIKAALTFFYGNKTMTARSLGISIRGLDGKIDRFSIDRKRVIADEVQTDTAEQENRRTDRKKNRGSIKKDALLASA